VRAVLVAPGDEVERAAPLVVLEAMKMELTVAAPAAGRVAEVRCAEGERVVEGAQLVVMEVQE
jgi:3-methylcrotonyl-CoA carboxylase alpha subunit